MRDKITGLVLTFNGERYLAETLKSLDFCDELLIVDSGSTDRTLEIAAEFGARVLHRKWEGTIPQFKFAFEHIATPWVVTLDQDEWLSPELRKALLEKLSAPGNACGFFLRRRSFYFDRFMRHSGWYPDYLFRVFRMDGFVLKGVLPHEEFHPQGNAPKIPFDIVHYPYADLSEQLRKQSAYSRAAAQELVRKGKKGGLGPALSHGLGRFIKKYFLKRGFLDGRAGFILAIYDFLYVFQKYLLVEELQKRDEWREGQ